MRSSRLSLLVALVLGCAGAPPRVATVAADMPPTVDCGTPIDAMAPLLDTPAVALVGERQADVPRLAGDLACQVAAAGHQVIVAIAPDAADAATGALLARIAAMRAAGLDVDVARDTPAASVRRLSVERPDAHLIVLGASAAAIHGVPAYAIDVVGDASAAAPPSLRASPERDGGFDAVLDLGGAAPAAAAVIPEA